MYWDKIPLDMIRDTLKKGYFKEEIYDHERWIWNDEFRIIPEVTEPDDIMILTITTSLETPTVEQNYQGYIEQTRQFEETMKLLNKLPEVEATTSPSDDKLPVVEEEDDEIEEIHNTIQTPMLEPLI